VIGLAAHLAAGRALDVPVTAAMTGACVVGALAGARVGERVPQRHHGRGFRGPGRVAAVAAYLLLSVALLGGPPTA